jgi:hypothetical protein
MLKAKENTTKPGRMSTRHKVWVYRFTQEFSRFFVKPQEGKNERGKPIFSGSIDYIL